MEQSYPFYVGGCLHGIEAVEPLKEIWDDSREP